MLYGDSVDGKKSWVFFLLVVVDRRCPCQSSITSKNQKFKPTWYCGVPSYDVLTCFVEFSSVIDRLDTQLKPYPQLETGRKGPLIIKANGCNPRTICFYPIMGIRQDVEVHRGWKFFFWAIAAPRRTRIANLAPSDGNEIDQVKP